MSTATSIKVQHEALYSPAGLSLSPGAFRVYCDFVRMWSLESRNGNRDIPSISLVWSQCTWAVYETAWNGYRAEIEAAGFIEAVNREQGLYRPSDAWKTKIPDSKAQAKAARIEAARAKRRARHAEIRKKYHPRSPEFLSRS